MSYAERAYAGPDIRGSRFTAEPVAHCAARDEAERLARLRRQACEAARRRLA